MNDQKIDQVAETLKLIAHPIRMRIILALAEQPSVNVKELQSMLDVEQSLLSQHLVKMKDRQLLTSIRRGQEIYYSLTDAAYTDLVKLLLKRES